MFEGLFAKYDKLLLFDTETTGLQFHRDEIIEFAAVLVEKVGGTAQVTREYDELITLSPGMTVPPEIERLTGISNEDILRAYLRMPRSQSSHYIQLSQILVDNNLG